MASAFLQSAAIVPPFMASPFIVSARTVVVPAASNPKAVATAKAPARNIRFIVVLSQSVGDRRCRSGPPACGHASGSRPVRAVGRLTSSLRGAARRGRKTSLVYQLKREGPRPVGHDRHHQWRPARDGGAPVVDRRRRAEKEKAS